jgi:hypothetical protein
MQSHNTPHPNREAQSHEMKRQAVASYIVVILIALLSLPGCNPQPEKATSFKTVFDHYKDRENIMAISIPPGLVGIFLSDNDPGQAELKKLMQELSAFRLLSMEEATLNSELAEELRMAVSEFTSRNRFQEFFRIQSSTEDVVVMIQEREGVVSEAVLMMNAGDNFFVIGLKGNISLDHITGLVEGGNLQDLITLSDIDF